MLALSLDAALYNIFIYRPVWQAMRPTPSRTVLQRRCASLHVMLPYVTPTQLIRRGIAFES
jgi:hypothetical protein